MNYLSTRNIDIKKSFNEILFQGLSKEGGLFMPSYWPKIFLDELRGKNYQDIAKIIIKPFLAKDFLDEDLKLIIKESYK